MVEVAWIILQHNNSYLLTQRSYHGTWTFPGDQIKESDDNIISTVQRELKEEIGLAGLRFRQVFKIRIDHYMMHALLCDRWTGQLRLIRSDIIGVGWFTSDEMYSLGHSLSPLVNESLMYFSYIMQHYNHHPEIRDKLWGECNDCV